MKSWIKNRKNGSISLWNYKYQHYTKLVAINSYLFYWMEQIMNNHHKIINLASLPELPISASLSFKAS